MSIAKHLPALQILIFFAAALLSAVSFNKFAAWIIATISAVCGLALAIYAMPLAKEGMSYDFGGWKAPVGIEYQLDMLNQAIILFINGILLFFLLFGRELIEKTITKYIDNKYQHLIYSILLFAHVGYIGVISSNDLFNIYVFIEISSLSAYVLMSKGRDHKALVGAFDYLILGTIGATLILISIGFFLALTGSLNITHISTILAGNYNSRIAITAIVFFLSGTILKMAFFPMHFWMIRAYSSASAFMLTYLAPISSILGVYILLRFMHFTIDGALIHDTLTTILRPTSMITIAICTFLALKTDNLKKIVIYSTASQIGYVFLLMTIWSARDLLFQLIALDAINKIALFTIIAHIQHADPDLNFKNIECSSFVKLLIVLAIIFSSGLPLTAMFLVKIKLYDLLLENGLILEFITVILGAVFGLLYHLKLAKNMFFAPKCNGTIVITTKMHGLTAIIIIQMIILIYGKDLSIFAGYTKSIIFN